MKTDLEFASKMTADPIERVPRDRTLPLSFAQEAWWSLHQGRNAAPHRILDLRLSGRLDQDILQAALDRVVARHEILRTVFRSINGTLAQVIEPPDSSVVIMKRDAVVEESVIQELKRREATHVFDLASGPLLRALLLVKAAQEHVLLIVLHRITCDARSVGLLVDELTAVYRGFANGQGDPVPQPELQYADYACWQRHRVTEDSISERISACVRAMSSAPSGLQPETDHQRSTEGAYAVDHAPWVLPTELSSQLRKLAQTADVPIHLVLLSSWAVLLSRWSGQDEVVIATRLANRGVPGTAAMIGPFEGAALLRIQLSDDASVLQIIEQVRAVVVAASDHQEVPFERIVQEFRESRAAELPFDAFMTLEESPAFAEVRGAQLVIREAGEKHTHSDCKLSLSVRTECRELLGTLGYARNLFESKSIERMMNSWNALLEGMAADPQLSISKLPLLTSVQRELVLRQSYDRAEASYSSDELIHELFEASARRSPDAVAVVCEDQSITYDNLNKRANQLARHLQSRGVGPDRPVALCVNRSIDMVVGMLGVLKAGGAYLPLDPDYPLDRLAYMCDAAAPQVLVTQKGLEGRLPEVAADVVLIDEDWQSIAQLDDQNHNRATSGVTPENLAYIIFTSGSTGSPKGAMNEHRGMVNRIIAQRVYERFTNEDICCQKTSISFVDAVFETLGPLCHGLPIVIVPSDAANDGEKMAALIAREGVTRLLTVPSLARSMVESTEIMRNLSGLRSWTLSGEEVRAELLIELQRRLPNCEFIIQYGSSEVSSDAAIYKSVAFQGSRVPLGRPVPNVQMYILDQYSVPTPIGVVGEIHVGGVGVGRGYLNRPELTAARFLCDPFSTERGARLYRTGDLGRWRADGTIDYLGRNDQQVKIRGCRVELGEVESQLLRLGQIREAAVVARADASGEDRLVSYVTLRDAGSEGTAFIRSIRSNLRKRVPEYMVPAAVVVMPALPRTPNGKLDRRALPAPGSDAYPMTQFDAPRRGSERTLAGVWQDLLQLERVGRRDNFFELGGHSLLAFKMMNRLRALGLHTDVRKIFENPILAELANALTPVAVDDRSVPPNLIPGPCRNITPQMLPLVALDGQHLQVIARSVRGGFENIQDIYPLTPLQEGLLFHHLLDEETSDIYVVPMLLSVSSESRLDDLVCALQRVIDRHDILRTAVLWEQLPHPVQVVQRTAELPVQRIVTDQDLATSEDTEQLFDCVPLQMNIRKAPLLRLHTAKDERRGKWYALLHMHHMIDDDTSLKILIAELVAFLERREDELSAPTQYREHVAQVLRSERVHDNEKFFREKLAGIEEPTALFGLLDVHGRIDRIDEEAFDLEATLAQRMRLQARRLSMTPATLFHAAWSLVVAGTSGRDDVVFGTVLVGRIHGGARMEHCLGMFINTLPLRIRLAGVTVQGLVEQVQIGLAELLIHEQASLVLAQRCADIPATLPLFNAVFNYRHGAFDPGAEWSRASGVRMLSSQSRTNYPIAISVDDLGDGFRLTAQTDRRVDPHRVVAYLNQAVQSLVEMLERESAVPALSLSILPEKESQEIDSLSRVSGDMPPSEALIQSLFESQVKRCPHALALVYKNETLTYAELNSRANQLARYLRERGVGGEKRVGIFFERGCEMLVAILGTLKAGGAYVPLDPDHPSDRLAYMLSDAAPELVLTTKHQRARLGPMRVSTITLDDDWADIGKRPAHDLCAPEVDAHSAHLAYVIYTSGSTGQAKGVMIDHHGVVNLWCGLESAAFVGRECTRVALNASLNFDASVQQLVQLLSGRTLFIVPQEQRRDASMMLSLIDDQRIEAVDCTPSQLRMWIAAGMLRRRQFPLRLVLVGGEAIDPDLWSTLACAKDIAFYNVYGPTECTVDATIAPLSGDVTTPHIGRPMANRNVYILNRNEVPVPFGVAGEICIGGLGIGRGYLNRPELTADKFRPDPGRSTSARRYCTGDLGRWRADGVIEYLGRSDQQVKIRGYRIELGEIEARLLERNQVKEAVVIAREDAPGEKRLVGYLVLEETSSRGSGPDLDALREDLKRVLPSYMVPSALVVLKDLPLTLSGKVNRRALPVPERDAFAIAQFEPALGGTETVLAEIWRQLLNIERVGRQDNFFELGGHSLLIVLLIERLRAAGLSVNVRSIYEHPTLASMASVLEARSGVEGQVPPNGIPAACEVITPQMLTLVNLTSEEIDRITESVPGGAANVADIYPLAPLQEGILFHHLLGKEIGDTYVLPTLLQMASRQQLDRFIEALQEVIDRHDVLRTAILWEHLSNPVQVVYRRATLSVAELGLDPSEDPRHQLMKRMRPEHQSMDLRHAPLARLQVAADPGGKRWYALLQLHHLVADHESLDMMLAEVRACIDGHADQLPEPIPYRNHVAQALAHAKENSAEYYFRKALGDVDEPVAPFGLLDTYGNGSRIDEARSTFDRAFAERIRTQSRRLSVSPATLFHAAWALVVAHTTGRSDVVFGTLLLGRLQGSAGAQRTLGMFINTLPLRIRLQDVNAQGLIQRTQHELVELLNYEQASLAIAQRCSGIEGTAPLFTTLLNYRHSAVGLQPSLTATDGIQVLAEMDWTNYPITLSVDDLGEDFALTAQTDRKINPMRVVGYVQKALQSLVEALEVASRTPALALSSLPQDERLNVLERFNATCALFSEEKLVHELFEEQAQRTPTMRALLHGDKYLDYSELSAQANQVARFLRARGVQPDQAVGICIDRSLEMVVAILGILKAGAAYLPLDPNYPVERLRYMVEDALPRIVLTERNSIIALIESASEIVALDEIITDAGEEIETETESADSRQTDHSLAYIIYTSGSTGRPKGIAMPHRPVVNLIEWHRRYLPLGEGQRVLQFAALSFDVAFQEIFSTLCTGGTLVLLDEWTRRDPQALLELIDEQSIERLFVPPLMLQSLAECSQGLGSGAMCLKDVITAGEQLRISRAIASFFARRAGCRLHNHYGPTESHVVTALTLSGESGQWAERPTIGKPISNSQIFILDRQKQPVAVGVSGEIYIGGVGIARCYLGRPDLTAERFVCNPLSDNQQSRMYRTGDVGRWCADGSIEYLGRNDDQVKIRGYRIELKDIEAQLTAHPAVKDAVVVVREESSGERRLVAYVTGRENEDPIADELRAHLMERVPDFMVPSAFVSLASLPLTPSGKLDKGALPVPEDGAYASREYDSPQGYVEEVLTDIWQSLLHVPRVGRNDNFFELGGHSLLGMKLIAQIGEKLGVKLPVIAVFQYSSIEQMAQAVQSERQRHGKQSAPESMEFDEGIL
ncbi:non-ribosomal peptide synthetase [Steroidobacter agaridevorans]|uniref:non-ribosomal peptide synthetase n=1 Tax=Steroidobacter agaridevorans TaxID=2695856 RepID=UPI00137AD949|nr:non-ribosomal peptide synthetase [Steroidobacter agaridevorans]